MKHRPQDDLEGATNQLIPPHRFDRPLRLLVGQQHTRLFESNTHLERCGLVRPAIIRQTCLRRLQNAALRCDRVGGGQKDPAEQMWAVVHRKNNRFGLFKLPPPRADGRRVFRAPSPGRSASPRGLLVHIKGSPRQLVSGQPQVQRRLGPSKTKMI